MRRKTEGFWTTLGIMCTGLLAVSAFLYSMYVSLAGSAVVGMPAEIVRPYQIRSWTAFGISVASLTVLVVLVIAVLIRRRRASTPRRDATPAT